MVGRVAEELRCVAAVFHKGSDGCKNMHYEAGLLRFAFRCKMLIFWLRKSQVQTQPS